MTMVMLDLGSTEAQKRLLASLALGEIVVTAEESGDVAKSLIVITRKHLVDCAEANAEICYLAAEAMKAVVQAHPGVLDDKMLDVVNQFHAVHGTADCVQSPVPAILKFRNCRVSIPRVE
ncbi:MAG: hypothetical protein P4M15_07925 [Alphaproteobacteria bacterium]|nr:hypothetical protein [Alphaproteobacteria bacterium]